MLKASPIQSKMLVAIIKRMTVVDAKLSRPKTSNKLSSSKTVTTAVKHKTKRRRMMPRSKLPRSSSNRSQRKVVRLKEPRTSRLNLKRRIKMVRCHWRPLWSRSPSRSLWFRLLRSKRKFCRSLPRRNCWQRLNHHRQAR